MDIVVSDTTALIIFAKSDSIWLLSNLFKKIYIPQAVYDELMAKNDIVKYRVKQFDKIYLKSVSDKQILNRIERLNIDKGEIEAISLAIELDLRLIIDERKGRKIALNQGLRIVGILGILIENYRQSFLSFEEVELYFELFKTNGLRVSGELERMFFDRLRDE